MERSQIKVEIDLVESRLAAVGEELGQLVRRQGDLFQQLYHLQDAIQMTPETATLGIDGRDPEGQARS